MSTLPPATHPLSSSPALHALLTRLHALSLAQARALSARGTHFPVPGSEVKDEKVFEEQLVALDEEKCKAMWVLMRAAGMRRVVEAGTSYGVSLLWLLHAVLANERALPPSSGPGLPALVIGTENEPSKAAKALSHVREGFGTLPAPLYLLEGDILQTLPDALAKEPDRSIDLLLLDIWAPLALPVLKIVEPKLRIGGVVLVDNVIVSGARYEELVGWVRRQGSGWKEVTLMKEEGGFGVWVYVGEE